MLFGAFRCTEAVAIPGNPQLCWLQVPFCECRGFLERLLTMSQLTACEVRAMAYAGRMATSGTASPACPWHDRLP